MRLSDQLTAHDQVVVIHDLVVVVNSEFDESKHPRAEDGKFTDAGGSSGRSNQYVTTVKGTDIAENPSHSALTKIVKNSELGTVRVLLHGDRAYFWSADNRALHHDVREAMGLPDAIGIIITRSYGNNPGMLNAYRSDMDKGYPENNAWLEKSKRFLKLL